MNSSDRALLREAEAITLREGPETRQQALEQLARRTDKQDLRESILAFAEMGHMIDSAHRIEHPGSSQGLGDAA